MVVCWGAPYLYTQGTKISPSLHYTHIFTPTWPPIPSYMNRKKVNLNKLNNNKKKKQIKCDI